jgi:hypothetical protein
MTPLIRGVPRAEQSSPSTEPRQPDHADNFRPRRCGSVGCHHRNSKGRNKYSFDPHERIFEKELEDFFVNYLELSGKTYRILGIKGSAPLSGYYPNGGLVILVVIGVVLWSSAYL